MQQFVYDLIGLPQSLISEGEDDEMGDDDEEEGKPTMPLEDKNKKSKSELHGMISFTLHRKNFTQFLIKTWHLRADDLICLKLQCSKHTLFHVPPRH